MAREIPSSRFGIDCERSSMPNDQALIFGFPNRTGGQSQRQAMVVSLWMRTQRQVVCRLFDWQGGLRVIRAANRVARARAVKKLKHPMIYSQLPLRPPINLGHNLSQSRHCIAQLLEQPANGHRQRRSRRVNDGPEELGPVNLPGVEGARHRKATCPPRWGTSASATTAPSQPGFSPYDSRHHLCLVLENQSLRFGK